MPTLTEVAKRAGVSIATVSKVLSGTPYFTEETRQKVMKAVEELGYVPNLAARALSSGRTNIIAVVFPYVHDTVFTDPHVQNILQGIEAECSERGYNLLLSTPRLSIDGPDENYLRLIQSNYLDGIVALDNVPTASVLPPALKKKLPIVAIGYSDYPCLVRADDLHGAQLLMQYVLKLGHRCIGFITVPPNLNYSTDSRLDGYHQVIDAHGLDYESLPKCTGNFSTASGVECAARLLQHHPKLTAIVALNDRMALGAIQYARQHGYQVPDDLTVVGYDDIPTAQLFSPSLTTINQQAPEMGRVAIRMLFDILDKKQKCPATVTIPAQLVIRDSSAPPR